MQFNPSKPFDHVYGICKEYPGARYEQAGYIYNASHKCLNPDSKPMAADEDPLEKARANLVNEMMEQTKIVNELAREAEANPTGPNKAKHTKALKKYEQLKNQLDEIEANSEG